MQLALRHKQLLEHYPQHSLTGMEHRVHQGSEAIEHDLVVLIGENIEQTAPRLALTIKQVLRNAARDKADSIGVKHWQDSAVRTYAENTRTRLFSLQAQQSEFDQQVRPETLRAGYKPYRFIAIFKKRQPYCLLDR